MRFLPIIFVLTMAHMFGDVSAIGAEDTPVASIDIYNPTSWTRPMPVKVAVGGIASEGSIDWGTVHLICDGQPLDFAFLDGHPHWKSAMKSPVEQPGPEDLLVFVLAVEPGRWKEVKVVEGRVVGKSHIEKADGKVRVKYPDVEVSIDQGTGMLEKYRVGGRDVHDQAMKIEFLPVKPGRSNETEGIPFSSELASYSSNDLLSELHYVLKPQRGPEMLLTYRVYSSGYTEIDLDERPWSGPSPWSAVRVKASMSLRGEQKDMPLLQNYAPYYGPKDFARVLKMRASVYRNGNVAVFEQGRDLINGRLWNRRFYPERIEKGASLDGLIEAADEGFVISVRPPQVDLKKDALIVQAETNVDALGVIVDLLRTALEGTGIPVELDSGTSGASGRKLVFKNAVERDRIGDEGYLVQAGPDSKTIVVKSRTHYGRISATHRIVDHLEKSRSTPGIPLVSANPVVPMRGVVIGGGPFEVGFPYGTEEDWKYTFDRLARSGINTVWSLGMWSNWKLPVVYKYMPKLRMDDESYDEVTGAKFGEYEKYHDQGLIYIKHLRDRGIKVGMEMLVGQVPDAFCSAYPEALLKKEGSSAGDAPLFREVKNVGPCFTHPTYHEYLQAYLRELVETYPLDEIWIVRDDHGKLCHCDRCKEYVEKSKTKDAGWELFNITHAMIKKVGYEGKVSLVPYMDKYKDEFEGSLPKQMKMYGYGAASALTVTGYDTLGLMADTWLDNIYVGFRTPTTSRMKRMLGEWGSHNVLGLYMGQEVTVESIGRFGCDPSLTVNTVRYDWASREFGSGGAIEIVRWLDVYERLRDLYNIMLLPQNWFGLDEDRRREISRESVTLLEEHARLYEKTKDKYEQPRLKLWIEQMRMFELYYKYWLGQSEILEELRDIVKEHQGRVLSAQRLPPEVRARIAMRYDEFYSLSDAFDGHAATIAELLHVKAMREYKMTRPLKDWVGGYGWFDKNLEDALEWPSYGGKLSVVSPLTLKCGEEYDLELEIHNSGIRPWGKDNPTLITLTGDHKKLGFPNHWGPEKNYIFPGDKVRVHLKGKAPEGPGESKIKLEFKTNHRVSYAFGEKQIVVKWDE